MISAKEEQFKLVNDTNEPELKNKKGNSTNALKVLYESLKNVCFCF